MTLGVKAERTGWRDRELSERHRLWGVDVPMVDIDFMVIEYDHAKPVVIVDFKEWSAIWPPPDDPNARAQGSLYAENGRQLPMVFVRYAKSPWRFVVLPGNDEARRRWPGADVHVLTERQFVIWQYKARGRVPPADVLAGLDGSAPEALSVRHEPKWKASDFDDMAF